MPHGAVVDAHDVAAPPTVEVGERRSMPAGLSAGVTSTIALVAKTFGVAAWTPRSALSMVAVSAVASTSAGRAVDGLLRPGSARGVEGELHVDPVVVGLELRARAR